MSRNALQDIFRPDDDIQRSSDRSFGLVFAVVFAIVGCWPLLGGNAVRWWALAIAAAFLGIALARPVLLAPLNAAWTRLGLLLHRIVNPIVMGLVFFFVVTPTGLIMRALGKDAMRRRFDRDAESYWAPRDGGSPEPETMKRQF